MPRAEAGSIKHLSNKMKSKGLQRLRWYCQPCEKQCRDENGYKCHVMSESHMRTMQFVTADPRRHIATYSQEFKRDFLQLLRTAHGEKPVHVNQFYQEYIRDKSHIHMNATQWSSLTEFAKYLGREGICRVTEEEKGIYIAWIDNSPEALKRREYAKKKEAEKWGDEQLEQKLLKEQEERAKKEVEEHGDEESGSNLERKVGEVVRFSLGINSPRPTQPGNKIETSKPTSDSSSPAGEEILTPEVNAVRPAATQHSNQEPIRISLGAALPSTKPLNAFASTKKKNVFANTKKNFVAPSKDPNKKMSNVERIMQEELESRKRKFTGPDSSAEKRMRNE